MLDHVEYRCGKVLSARWKEKIIEGKVIKSNVQPGFIFVKTNLRVIEELGRREGVLYMK